MLPALYFIFSRAACDDAVRACLDAGLRLTTPDERVRIRDDRRGAHRLAHRRRPRRAGLRPLARRRWRPGLAAHHAGMVPPFKETVEACFAEGLVKAVFATETLALGVNMPARSVVIERLTKFAGERPGVPHAGGVHPAHRAGPAAGGSTSSATPSCCGRRSSRSTRWPTWRRAAPTACAPPSGRPTTWPPTWCAATSPPEARHLLNLSFAQFQADRAVVLVEARIERHQERIARLRREAACDRGDVEEYQRLRQAEVEAPGGGPARAQRGRVRRCRGSCRATSSRSTGAGWRCCRSPSARAGRQAPRHRDRRRRGEPDARRGDRRAGAAGPHRAAQALRAQQPPLPAGGGRAAACEPAWGAGRPAGRAAPTARPAPTAPVAPVGRRDTTSVVVAHRALADHPVHSCPDRDRHARALAQLGRAQRELDGLQREVRSRTESLARRFDKVLRLLEGWGYLDGWSLTAPGADAGPHLPRGRPAGRRGHRLRPARRARRAVAGRADVVLHLRAPGPGPAPPPVFPHPAAAVAGRRPRDPGGRPAGRRGPHGPARHPHGRPRLRGHRPRVGGRRGAGRRAGRRGPLRRRLRPQRQDAARPGAPGGRRGPRPGHGPGGPPGRRGAAPRRDLDLVDARRDRRRRPAGGCAARRAGWRRGRRAGRGARALGAARPRAAHGDRTRRRARRRGRGAGE